MPFSKFGLNPKLLQAVKDLGFETPTPIQSMAIPPQMEGRDVIAAAVTGSGKTAAFLLPILHSLMEKPRGKTRALVLAPTRELAAQIADHLKDLAAHTHLKGAAVYGGVGMQPQVKAFQRGVDVIVATPEGSWTTSNIPTPSWTPSNFWSSTRRTGCSTWGSCPTCAAS